MTERAKPLSGTTPADAFDVAVGMLNREQRRSRRKRDVRARTISVTRMTKRELESGRMLYPEAVEGRPLTRGDCADAPRPCPYVGCKHHLFLDVSAKTGAIKLNFPDLEPWEMAESCALDLADQGEQTLEDVGTVANLTRERIRQCEAKAFRLIKQLDLATYEEHADGDRKAVRAHQQEQP